VKADGEKYERAKGLSIKYCIESSQLR